MSRTEHWRCGGVYLFAATELSLYGGQSRYREKRSV